MESGGHIWEERISTNLFLTHYLVRGIEMICLDQTQKGNGVFKGEKITKEKPVSQNAVCGKSLAEYQD